MGQRLHEKDAWAYIPLWGWGGGGLAAVAMRVVRYRWTLACTGGLTADIRLSRAHALDSEYGCKRSQSTRSSGGRAGHLRPGGFFLGIGGR